ncbi:MAG: hypothetical protein IJF62_00130 [Firmicutes bacterium]|nr:hypothetical protein [Bacillota bacterium]MBQ3111524.1 hypothetical protein [Bacillota bacterium]MBQ6842766.1 hypothetical protein [Bacillota bacterium]MBR6824520.1 hypothetical protein [Bacillota bacterium]MBR7113401.1 hypothetical protein [Bacillota bacterium]
MGLYNCEYCSNYEYDEINDEYYCIVCDALDQDDMYRFLDNRRHECPFYKYNAEYEIAHKQ